MRARFAVAPDAEVTVECNPESVSRDKLAAYRAAGVNRISLGVQSLDDAILPRLGRLHDARRGPPGLRGGARRPATTTSASISCTGCPDLDVDGVDAERRGRPRLGARASLRVRPHARRGQPVGRRRAWRACRPRAPWSSSTGRWPARRRRADSSTTRSPTTRGRAFARATTRSTGAPPSTWPPAPGPAASSATCATATSKPVARYCATLEAGALPIETSERLTARQQDSERLFLGLRLADGVPRRRARGAGRRGARARAPDRDLARGRAAGGSRRQRRAHRSRLSRLRRALRRPALATPLAHGGAMFELETPQDLLQHIGKRAGPLGLDDRRPEDDRQVRRSHRRSPVDPRGRRAGQAARCPAARRSPTAT